MKYSEDAVFVSKCPGAADLYKILLHGSHDDYMFVIFQVVLFHFCF
jgi:hypothetical protein